MRAGSDVRAWVTGTINPVAVGAPIPSTFLGISHEWTNVEELNHGGRHQQLIQDLRAYGGGPLVLRVGGGSTDMQTALPPRSTWDALLKLQHATGARRACARCCAHTVAMHRLRARSSAGNRHAAPAGTQCLQQTRMCRQQAHARPNALRRHEHQA